jgi:hypothetical protein
MDVEGAEAMALGGATELLKTSRPRLAIELHGPEHAHDVLRILWASDYFCYGYLEENGERRYKRIAPDDLPRITDQYSLHFVAAAPDENELASSIEGFA